MKNPGKVFEENFRDSIPDGVYYKKFTDSALGFDIENSTQRFSMQSPYDYIIYKFPHAYAIECKSAAKGGISFASSNPMIKKHQIEELIHAASCGLIAGFVINFRNTENTYFLPIAQFEFFRQTTDKKSFNENDIRGLSILIPHRKLRVNFRYDLSVLIGGD